ncbi:MAG TPA: PEP-CTERM sorting domain-containing protein [Candidatus Binatia bacterium]|nr:PEP-CTERM sorting domain-containing protein [Candidatus Binatia bacterium]
MKIRIATLILLLVALVAIPAAADTLYSNGPTNGTTDGWTINFGFIVSDTFTLSAASTVTGLTFATWMEPGDTLLSAQVAITSSEFGGTQFFNSVVNFTQSGCSVNQYGFDLCTESGTFNVALNSGTYWLNLENAVSALGDPVYWDENSGPSMASENSVGTIPSESFTLTGTTGGGTVPEPSSILLVGSGILGLAGMLRRRLF